VRYLQKEAERRRRLREEELARQQELLRLQALAEAEKGDMEPSLSLEERARLEMEENAKNLAKEHPDSVAKLLRTWMSE
jgi:flagellar M-ring protein FliF